MRYTIFVCGSLSEGNYAFIIRNMVLGGGKLIDPNGCDLGLKSSGVGVSSSSDHGDKLNPALLQN